MEKAGQELDILKLPEQERLAYARYRDDLHYQASMVESSYVVGIKKGEQKGREQGAAAVAQHAALLGNTPSEG